jgi:N-acetylgalactosamine kinase
MFNHLKRQRRPYIRGSQNEIVSIILAAGKSSRMRADGRAKVCFPVGGKPAIIRLLETLRIAGIKSHVIVVGYHAEEVMRTVSEQLNGEVWFAFQPQALGTGNAAKCGMQFLLKTGFNGSALLIAGDKVIKPGAIERLLRLSREQKADLAMMIADREIEPAAGRIIFSQDARPIASIEKFDSGKSRLLALYFSRTDNGAVLEADRALTFAQEFIGSDKKLPQALGELYRDLREGTPLTRAKLLQYFSPEDRFIAIGNGKRMTGAEIEKSRYVNLSVYLFKAGALKYALSQLSNQNAQNEEYLTDALAILSASGKYKIVAEKIASKDEVLAFNTPEELKKIEAMYRLQENYRLPANSSNARFFTTTQWLEMAGSRSGELRDMLAKSYGSSYDAFDDKIELLKSCLLKFYQRFGDGPVTVTRAPARVNLMGRHVDHQGGVCNTVGIDLEVFFAARSRADHLLRLRNIDDRNFPEYDVHPDDFQDILFRQRWLQFISHQRVKNYVNTHRGSWSNYLLAVFLRLQKRFPEVRLKGMDITVAGNIPPAAGLSSSSALVVAAAEAILRNNELSIDKNELITLCAEADWFVGTRSGAADHAAIALAENGKVLPLRFFPLEKYEAIAWPSGCSLVVVNSGKSAEKSNEAQDIFNQRIACYRFGFDWLLKEHPRLFLDVQHIRNLYPENLRISLADFYKLIKSLPENMQGREIANLFPVDWSVLMPNCPNPENYLFAIRDTVFYGAAECARSRMFGGLLAENKLAEIGNLMNISHDGDRVARKENGRMQPFRNHYDGALMDRLIRESAKDAEQWALPWQPGAYGCSTPEIDALVDLAKSVEGVFGAQIAGAGLGGSLMVFAKQEAVNDCLAKLNRHFFAPRSLVMLHQVCRPVGGSGVLA